MRCAVASSSPAKARGVSAAVYSASERQSSRKGRASNVLLELLLEALVDAVAKVLDRVLAALQNDRRLIVRQLAARLGVTVFPRAARQQWPLPTSARTTRAVKWPAARLRTCARGPGISTPCPAVHQSSIRGAPRSGTCAARAAAGPVPVTPLTRRQFDGELHR